jgi:hypothetical protein
MGGGGGGGQGGMNPMGMMGGMGGGGGGMQMPMGIMQNYKTPTKHADRGWERAIANIMDPMGMFKGFL